MAMSTDYTLSSVLGLSERARSLVHFLRKRSVKRSVQIFTRDPVFPTWSTEALFVSPRIHEESTVDTGRFSKLCRRRETAAELQAAAADDPHHECFEHWQVPRLNHGPPWHNGFWARDL